MTAMHTRSVSTTLKTQPASRHFKASRRGLAVLLLTERTAANHAMASTLWRHQHKSNFREYDNEKDEASPRECDASLSATSTQKCRPQAQAHKQTGSRFSQRFLSLVKRETKFRTDIECCFDCQDFIWEELCRNSNSAMSLPRGGHLHHKTASPHGAAESIITAAGAATVGIDAVTPYNIPLNLWKIIFQTILTTINVLCWLIPLRSTQISNNKLGLSLANAFSGGVFLSLAFGHLIPECVNGFHGAVAVAGGGELNEALPYMIVLGGYLLIFFVEKVAFDAHEIMHDMQEGAQLMKHHHNHHQNNNADSDAANSNEHEKVTINGSVVSRQESGGTGRSAVILLGALAVHSILEMTALGLADSFGDSALLSLSIALHQPAESIALLVAFLKSGMPKPQIIKFLSIFSCMGPIGVAIGMAVNNFASPFIDATMLAVVAGTFVYVGATEVIPEEWENSEHKWKKFLALISGIVSIFAITQYTMVLQSVI